MSPGLFKNNVTYKLFVYKSNIYKPDFALNKSQGFVCHKNQPTVL